MKFQSSVTVATVDFPPPWETLELVDLGFFQLLCELARVGGHGVEETPLAFGEEDVESESGLAGP
jgi:hypothetical protein